LTGIIIIGGVGATLLYEKEITLSVWLSVYEVPWREGGIQDGRIGSRFEMGLC
jgi:hypothetical protein